MVFGFHGKLLDEIDGIPEAIKIGWPSEETEICYILIECQLKLGVCYNYTTII